MKLVTKILAVLILAVLVVVAIGYALPMKHSVSRERTYSVSAETLFALIANPSAYPEWRTGVTRVQMLAPVNGLVSFRESGSDDDIIFVMETVEPGRRVVSRIADKNLPFGGSWTYEVTPAVGGTQLRITEDGEVYNPVFRFISRFILGHYKSIDQFLDDVERRLTTR